MLAPAISPRFLDNEYDCKCLISGMRIARDIIGNTALDAYRDIELKPGININSDEDLLAFARMHGDTAYHPIGTCRIGNNAETVVDHRLRVHGIQALRVIDVSIMPTLVLGNTNANFNDYRIRCSDAT